MGEVYDFVIIGSGLGGLVCANILAKEGYSVCVLEKNNQYGGNLQTFVRDKTIFDTGVHYLGGLSEGQNLFSYFNYLGIIKELELQKMEEDGFDIITFGDNKKEYKHAQGYENFITTLVNDFPNEKEAIVAYCNKVRETCAKFPLYELKIGKPYLDDVEMFEVSAKQYIDSLTANETLKAVLAGTNLLYAGDSLRTPFYVHALSVNSYIESSYRVKNGGSQITKLLIRRLKENGGQAYNHHEVVSFNFENDEISSVFVKNGKEIKGKKFISNVDPKLTLRLIGEGKMRKSYVNRIESIESVISGFSLYIVLKPQTFKYQNKNFYHYKSEHNIWDSQNYTEGTWPESYMISMGVKKNASEWGDSLTAMTYMRYEEVEKWENTYNTVANENDRGKSYEDFKAEKTDVFLREIEKKIPNIRECILSIHTSTPLSYRDYIGIDRGSIYGYVKDVNNPLQSFVSPKTKIKNLLFTGQCLNMHGILGVTIGGVLTCSEILGQEYLLNKIIEANKV